MDIGFCQANLPFFDKVREFLIHAWGEQLQAQLIRDY
jgi:hypothetical protein